jgi:undecaprenyl-diphosphatase
MKSARAKRLPNSLAWIGRADPAVLLMAFAILMGACSFILVAYGVSHGITQHLDEELLKAPRDPDDPSRSLGPTWLEEFGRDLTALGGVAGLCLMILAISGYLLISRKYRALAFVLAATIGGLLLNGALKERFHRPRPNVVPYKSQVMTSSFPSGHSLNSAVVYLTLGSLLASLVEQRRLKIYFFSVAMLLTVLVGISRVYMGVHYPTDVVAGWSAGLAWAMLCSLIAHWLRKRRAIERVDTVTD